MKRVCVLVFLVLFSVSAVLASPTWVSNVIESSKSDSVSPDAPAFILYDHCRVEVDKGDKSESLCRFVISLKSPSAAESVQFELKTAGLSKIKDFRAWQIKADGFEETYGKKDLVEFSLFEGSALHHDTKSLKLLIPELDVGDVIAYEYKIESNGIGSRYHEFVVQHDLPTRDFEVELKIPDKWNYQIGGPYSDSLAYSLEEGYHVWRARDLAYRSIEPYMAEDKSSVRFFMVNCFDGSEKKDEQFASWSDVARWYRQNLPETGEKLNIPTVLYPENEVFADDTSGVFYLDCQIVKDKIRYVGVEIGEGRFRPRAPQVTIDNRYGDCKDKAFLLQSMLAEDGVQSYLTLVHSPGPIDPNITSPYQFNHVILAIEREGLDIRSANANDTGRYIFFDPTYPALEPGHLPRSLQNDYGVVIRSDTAEVVVLPATPPASFREERKAEFTIHSKDSLSGKISIFYDNCSEGVEHYRRSQMSRDKQIEELSTLLGSAISGVNITSFDSFDPMKRGDVLATISGRMAGSMAGPVYLLRTNPIVEVTANLLRSDKERFFPIWFGDKEEVDCEIIWHVPPEWRIEILDTLYADSCLSSSLSVSVSSPDSASIIWKSRYRTDGRVLSTDKVTEAARFEKVRNAAYGSRTLLHFE